MNSLIISIIIILLVIFIIIATDTILRNNFSYVITSTEEVPDSIEAQLRIILKENPISDIIVIDKSESEESKQILEKLSADFPQLHIVKADR